MWRRLETKVHKQPLLPPSLCPHTKSQLGGHCASLHFFYTRDLFEEILQHIKTTKNLNFHSYSGKFDIMH